MKGAERWRREKRKGGGGVPKIDEEEDEWGRGKKTSFSVTICSNNKFRDFMAFLSNNCTHRLAIHGLYGDPCKQI